MVRQDLSEGHVKVNLLSPTAMSHHVRKQEVCPLHAVPNVSRRVGQEGQWPRTSDKTFADTLYHTKWFHYNPYTPGIVLPQLGLLAGSKPKQSRHLV